jgi:hypothetical protein
MLVRLFILACSVWFAVLPISAQQADTLDADVDAYDYRAPIDPSQRHFPPGAFYPDRPDLDPTSRIGTIVN